jgi:hypothetical protein
MDQAQDAAADVAPAPLIGPPWRDDAGRSPWLGRFRHYEEFLAANFPKWEDPFTQRPDEDLLIDGINGAEGISTQYRLGRELWIDGETFSGWNADLRRLRDEYGWAGHSGFLYREALSCMQTTSNARMRAAQQYMNEVLQIDLQARIYITEQITPLFETLSKRYPNLVGSEYLPGEPLGRVVDGIRCEDLTRLTFDDEEFDYILSFDVLEHVADYHAAIGQMARILKPGGILLMTAPLTLGSYKSMMRARVIDDGTLVPICPPEYHVNPLGPPSLCITTFGFDLIEDIRTHGFSDSYAELYANKQLGYWGPPQPLLIGVK